MEWQDYHLRRHKYFDSIKNKKLLNLESQLDKESYLIFITGSFGDVYGSLLLLEKFLDEYRTGISLIIDKRYHRLVERFAKPELVIYFLESDASLRGLLGVCRGRYMLRPGEIYPTLPTMHPLIAEAVLSRRITIVEAWRLILGLPKATPLRINPLSPIHVEELAQTKKYIEAFGRPTICIFASNQSNSRLPFPLLKIIVNNMREHGIEPVLNLTGSNSLDEFRDLNLSTLSIGPHLLIETCELFNGVVTTASGVSAILGMIPNKANVAVIRSSSNITTVSYRNYGYALNDVQIELGADFCEKNRIQNIIWSSEEESWPDFAYRLKDSLIQ